MSHAIWLTKIGGGDVVVRIYVEDAPATLVMNGFCDCDPDALNRLPDPNNPLMRIELTSQKIYDVSSPLITELKGDEYYDIELGARAFMAGTTSDISHAVLQGGQVVPAVVNNKIGNRRTNGTYKRVALGKAKHVPSDANVFSTHFSIDSI